MVAVNFGERKSVVFTHHTSEGASTSPSSQNQKEIPASTIVRVGLLCHACEQAAPWRSISRCIRNSEVSMLPRTFGRAKCRRHSISLSSPYAPSTVVALSRAFRLYMMLLICAVATLRLTAQTLTPEEKKKCETDVSIAKYHIADVAAPTAGDEIKQRENCEKNVLNSGKPEDAKPPQNIADATKTALACEWIDPNAVDNVLAAFYLLTSGPRTEGPRCIIHVLEIGDKYPSDKGVYSAAMGNPDKYDQPATQGLPDFLDVLAKANTLKKKAPEDEDTLFAATKTMIQVIFGTEQGKRDLLQINDSFAHNDNNVALRQLLTAYHGDDSDKVSYVKNLERLRAAFEMNSAKLAKQIAATIKAAKN